MPIPKFPAGEEFLEKRVFFSWASVDWTSAGELALTLGTQMKERVRARLGPSFFFLLYS